MFYRIRVDNNIAAILKRANMSSDEIIEFWPPGATKDAVSSGQQLGLTPVEAAALGVAMVARKRNGLRQMGSGAAQNIVILAHLHARLNGARSEVLNQLQVIKL